MTHIFWSEIGSGFEEPGGTPPPRIPRGTPPEVVWLALRAVHSSLFPLFGGAGESRELRRGKTQEINTSFQ